MGRISKRQQPSVDRTYAALVYYRRPQWTPRLLRDKVGRLAIRMLALNRVYYEKAEQELLAQNVKRALKQLIPRKPAAPSR